MKSYDFGDMLGLNTRVSLLGFSTVLVLCPMTYSRGYKPIPEHRLRVFLREEANDLFQAHHAKPRGS